jgi:hypothetical protein
LCALHTKQVTIMPKDIILARRIRGEQRGSESNNRMRTSNCSEGKQLSSKRGKKSG